MDLLSSGEEGDMWLLTIWRNGKFFEIFTRGPLGGIFEFTGPDESQMIMELFKKERWGKKVNIEYTRLLGAQKVVDVYDTTHSQVAVILPPVWLLQQKMWEPLLAILCVYLITFSVNIFLFILAVILIGLYFRKESGYAKKKLWTISGQASMGYFGSKVRFRGPKKCTPILMRKSISSMDL